MLETALDEKVAEAVDHERVGLGNNSLDNFIFLLGGAHLELLLKEDRCLLVVVAHNLVNDVLPIAVDVAVEEATVVQRLSGWQVGLTLGSHGLDEHQVHQHRQQRHSTFTLRKLTSGFQEDTAADVNSVA